MEYGALSVRAIATHCVMSGPACDRVEKSALVELLMTDSIPFTKECSKVKVLSIADMFGDTIERVCRPPLHQLTILALIFRPQKTK